MVGLSRTVQLQDAFKLALSVAVFYWLALVLRWPSPKNGAIARTRAPAGPIAPARLQLPAYPDAVAGRPATQAAARRNDQRKPHILLVLVPRHYRAERT